MLKTNHQYYNYNFHDTTNTQGYKTPFYLLCIAYIYWILIIGSKNKSFDTVLPYSECAWWPINLIRNNHYEYDYEFEIAFKIEFEVKLEPNSEFKIEF